jgi:hypothetical protein
MVNIMSEFPKHLYSDTKGEKAEHEKVYHIRVNDETAQKVALSQGYRLTLDKPANKKNSKAK